MTQIQICMVFQCSITPEVGRCRQGMKVHLMTYKDNSDGDSSWCTFLISGSNITAKVKHAGSGKYRIMANVTLLIIDLSGVGHACLILLD